MTIFQNTLSRIFGSSFTRPEEAMGPKPDQYPNDEWNVQSARYRRYWNYWSGNVFNETTSPDDDTLKYPVAVNICRNAARLNAWTILGEYDETVMNWKGKTFDKSKKYDASTDGAVDFLDTVAHFSRFSSRYVRNTLTMSVYGGCVWGIRYDPTIPTHARWITIPPMFFYPIFSSLDDELIEAHVQFKISAAEAMRRWPQVRTDDNQVDYFEKWTNDEYEISVGETVVASGVPRARKIPFVYIPTTETVDTPYGLSSFDGIMGIQDEFNARLADIGDAVNQETHRDVYISGVPGGAQSIRKHGKFVDLGNALGRHAPTTHDVDRGRVPEGSFDFSQVLVDFSRFGADTPSVAFGEDEGSQRSSMTLQLRMYPMLKAAQATRANVRDQMTRLFQTTIDIARSSTVTIDQKADVYMPDFPAMLPKDREQIVQEVVALWGTGDNPVISDEWALSRLDVPEHEHAKILARIKSLRKEVAELNKPPAPIGGIPGAPGSKKPGGTTSGSKAAAAKKKPTGNE